MMKLCVLAVRVPVLVFVFAFASIPAAVLVRVAGADAGVASSNIDEYEWRSSVELARDGGFRLSWIPLDHRIVFLAEAKTTGYLGVGFSADGRMAKADIVVGWLNDGTKKPYLVDCHGDEVNAVPIKDTIQNYELLNGRQNSTHTVLMFTRLWNTCDKSNDIMIGNDTTRIIWALGGEDPADETLYNIMWHAKERGSRSLNLRNPPTRSFQREAKQLDLKLPEVSLPQNMATVYWCKIFRLPPLASKHHIIGYTPILQEANSELIHHMLLYECNEKLSPSTRMNQYSSENGFLCYSPKMPNEAETCITPVVTWAIGSQGEFFPKHVGLPIGETPKQEKYYMLEVHYDNPSLREVVDSSGVRLHYTEHLRKHDGGIFTSGTLVSPLHIIPPYQAAYKTAGYCDKYCTNTVFPLNGVNSVSVVLHSHSAAKKMRLRHFRQGEELPPIVQDEHYDYNYQQSRELSREVTIFPGDELVTECTYNTLNRTHPTQGGLSTKQEMCLAYITYYPKVSLAACQSMNPIQFFFFAFGIKKFYLYDMDTIEKIFLKLTDKQIKRPKKSTATPTFPTSASGHEFDEKVNQAHISALKQMTDYTIEEPEETNLFQDLVISDPPEFQNKTFSQHMLDLPWKEIHQSLENMLYYGKHMTFCRLENDSLALPATVHLFPNITVYKVPTEDNVSQCKLKTKTQSQTNTSKKPTKNVILVLLFSIMLFKV